MTKIKAAFVLISIAGLILNGSLLAADAKADSKTYTASGKIIRMAGNMFLLRSSAADIEMTYDAKTKITNGPLAMNHNAKVMYVKVSGAPHATEVIMGK